MNWIIYKHTNKINGKIYIGQTKQTANARWKNGLGYNTHNYSSVFAKAISKYGWSNFEHEIIETDIHSQEKANEREIFWINFYRSYIGFDDCNGYNMTLGGDSGEHLGYSVYQIDKKTLKIINEFPSTAEASRQFGNGEANSSQIRRCCDGEKPSCKGYYWCYKEKYSSGWKPKDNLLVSPVLQIDDNLNVIRLYESISEAKNKNGFSSGSITSCCQRKQRKANGFFWCYAREYSADWRPVEVSFKRNEKIYCFETGEIYMNANDAHDKTGANTGKILRCCNKKEKGTNGLHFCFLKDKEFYVIYPSKKRSLKFSEDENKLIKKLYPQIGADIVKFLPSRTRGAINTQASRLGVKYCGVPLGNKKVLCIETGKIFDSMKEAALSVGLKDGTGITKCCKGERTIAGGYHWEYVE